MTDIHSHLETGETHPSLEVSARAILNSEVDDFYSLVKIAGLDPLMDLAGTDLSGINLISVNLKNANLSDTNLDKTDLSFSDFTATNLRNSSLVDSIILRSRFDNAILDNANFSGSRIENASFLSTSINNAVFENARIKKTIFAEVEMNNVSFKWSILEDVRFNNCRVTNIFFTNAKINRVVFMSTTFSHDVLKRLYARKNIQFSNSKVDLTDKFELMSFISSNLYLNIVKKQDQRFSFLINVKSSGSSNESCEAYSLSKLLSEYPPIVTYYLKQNWTDDTPKKLDNPPKSLPDRIE